MVLLLDCPEHGLPRRRLCANDACCELLCDDCLPTHASRTHHSIAICLNAQAINFFEQFTDQIHRAMQVWAETVRGKGFGAIFRVETGKEAGGEWAGAGAELTGMAASVLEEHGRLMACNKSFATSNCNSSLLYHPEFLKDLFNLIVHPWRRNAQLVLAKLAHSAAAIHSNWEKSPLRFGFREEVAVEIQNYREELLRAAGGTLVEEMREAKGWSANDGDTEDRSASSTRELSSSGEEVSQFRLASLPLSIKVIESFEQIEHPPAEPTETPPPFAPHMAFSEEKLEQNPKSGEQNDSQVCDSMQKLKEENQRLLRQNSALRNESLCLGEENTLLKQKCERMRMQRKPHPSSSKKYRQLELDSELLAEIVDLEAELNDNRHDLQILVAYLNSLSLASKISPSELNARMASLRTVSMH